MDEFWEPDILEDNTLFFRNLVDGELCWRTERFLNADFSIDDEFAVEILENIHKLLNLSTNDEPISLAATKTKILGLIDSGECLETYLEDLNRKNDSIFDFGADACLRLETYLTADKAIKDKEAESFSELLIDYFQLHDSLHLMQFINLIPGFAISDLETLLESYYKINFYRMKAGENYDFSGEKWFCWTKVANGFYVRVPCKPGTRATHYQKLQNGDYIPQVADFDL